jgi:hypothetical protein
MFVTWFGNIILRPTSDNRFIKHSKNFTNEKHTVVLSFLKRERHRTVNVILQSFQTVPDRPTFLTVPKRFVTVSVL